MVISTVARSAAQVMECSRILSDNVRTFHIDIGLGTTYASSFNNDAQVRSDAIAEHKRKTAEDPEYERLIQLKKPMRKQLTADDNREMAELRAVADATNSHLQRVKLSFRDSVVDKGKFSQPVRRSLLARSQLNPHLLAIAASAGRPQQFEAERLVFVDGRHAARLDCDITRVIVVIKPQTPKRDFVFEVTFARQDPVVFSAPFRSLQAAVMDLEDGSKGETDSVVNITLVFASQSKAQVFSILLKKKDVNTCRMLVNLKTFQKAFLESAIVPGNNLTDRAKILRAVQRDMAQTTTQTPGTFSAGIGRGWAPIIVSESLEMMPGLRRVAKVVEDTETTSRNRTPNLSVLLSSVAPQISLFERRSGTTTADGQGTATPVRTVKCWIEEADEAAVVLQNGQDWLTQKWGGLKVFSPADRVDKQLMGKVARFEWWSEYGKNLSVVNGKNGAQRGDWPVGVAELPKMVMAAEQDPNIELESFADADCDDGSGDLGPR